MNLTQSRSTGRFFSLQQGQVGQFLSDRVLHVTKPFQKATDCYYIGFDERKQAMRFMRRLGTSGQVLSLQRAQYMSQSYEIQITLDRTIASDLALWERLNIQ
ncbi:MAG: hypothetical protein HC860_05015 [Alkalinema sp. RU_4_3]|nr:hypothetical protein [Alkalinema sp. RU_4_3]